MKNITEILAGLDIQIPEDKQAEFDKTFAENYKTIADYDRQKDKLAHAEGDLKTAQESLEAFKNVDVKDLQNQISKLTQDLKDMLDQLASSRSCLFSDSSIALFILIELALPFRALT